MTVRDVLQLLRPPHWVKNGFVLVGLLFVSLAYGSFYGMGAVYALELGLEGPQIASFMASGIMGAVLLQWPIGMISDRMDRRRLIVILSAAVTVVGLLLAVVPADQTGLIYTLMFLFGGMSLPLYGVFVALAGDMLAAEELVAASPEALVLPKCESRDDVAAWDAEVGRLEGLSVLPPGSILFMPLVETARGVARALEIAEASARSVALCFGGEDYRRDLGVERVPTEQDERSGPVDRLRDRRGLAQIESAQLADERHDP